MLFLYLTLLSFYSGFSSEIVDDRKPAMTLEEKKLLIKKKRRLKQLKARKALLMRKNQDKPKPKPFSLHDLNPVVRYNYTTDINEQTDALDGTSAVSLALSHRLRKRVDLFSGVSVAYSTLGSSVFRPSPNDDFFKISDIYLGAGYQADVPRPWVLHFGGSVGAPISERSRFEGYRAIASLSGTLNNYIPKVKNLSAGIGLSFDYIFNSFDFSPTTNTTQPESRGSFSATVAYKLPYGFRYIGSIWTRLTLFVDNSTLTRFGNSHTLFWTYDNISTYIRYSNSDVPERGATDFWFIDEYRKVFTLGVIVRTKRPQLGKQKRRSRPFNSSQFEEE